MDADFCIETVGNLLERRQCEIFNTDQGSQFTTPRFTLPSLDKGIKVSMDGRGLALDNIPSAALRTGFVERLWRTVTQMVMLCTGHTDRTGGLVGTA